MIAYVFQKYPENLAFQIFKIWQYPVDTGRKLNIHKTFRRRPGQ